MKYLIKQPLNQQISCMMLMVVWCSDTMCKPRDTRKSAWLFSCIFTTAVDDIIYRSLQVRHDSYKLIANGRDSTRKIIHAWGTENDIQVWSIHGGVTVVYSLSTCAWAL